MMRTDRFRLTHETLDHNSSRNEGRVTLESEDWKKLPTVQERRRVQNRIAQRKFRSSAKKVSAKQCDSEKSLDQRLNLQDSVDPGFFQSDYVLAGLADTSNSMAQTMPPLDDAALTVPHYSQNFFPPLGVGWTANQEDNAEGRLEGNALGEDVMISQDAETIFPQVPKRNESSAIPSHVQQKAFAKYPHDQSDDLRLLDARKATSHCKPECSGNTPLHEAVLYGHFNIAQTLIERGATVDATNECGQTPLHLAVLTNGRPLASLLLEKGASVNERDSAGVTALHSAVTLGNQELMLLLLDFGAQINARVCK